jgi:hypothetical protein
MSQRTCLLVKASLRGYISKPTLFIVSIIVFTHIHFITQYIIYYPIWISTLCSKYFGYLHSEPGWFTTLCLDLVLSLSIFFLGTTPLASLGVGLNEGVEDQVTTP